MRISIEELQDLVKAGNFEQAARHLRARGQVARKNVATLGNIAWRIHQPSLAIKILHPVVRPKSSLSQPATAAEKIEYAEALRRVGAVNESWQLLGEIDTDTFPQALLYKIFCLFNQWRYDESLPLLRKYIELKDLTAYARAVGQINLAAALVQVGNLTEAADTLLRLREETLRANFTLLYGNALELSAQVCILQKDFKGALDVLAESANLLKDTGGLFGLFIEKWKAIAESLQQGRASEALTAVLLKAQTIKHWETVRDCELYIALLEKNELRFQHLYFGTPFGSFRQRIMNFAGPTFKPRDSYLWSLAVKPKSVLDLSTGIVSGKQSGFLPMGQALHRFFILLGRDLYRPLPALGAFGLLFPDEHMNAETSSNRVHQVVKRCREWIQKNGLDLRIEEEAGGYRLALGFSTGVLLPAILLPLETKELQSLLLEKAFGQKRFQIHDVTALLRCSNSNAQRLLRWASDQERLERSGKGSRTTYQVRGTARMT